MKTQKELIQFFLFVKDEIDYIDTWLKHHLRIANQEDLIHIVDNGSTDGTLELIRENYPAINLYYEKDFLKRQSVVSNIIRKAKHKSHFAVPLDADEFFLL